MLLAPWWASLPAAAFPVEDARLERSVLEASQAVAPARGGWSTAGGALALQAPTGGLNYWLADEGVGGIADGLVRARLRQGRRTDCTLLFRARVGAADPRELDAYGLSIENGKVALYRWRRGDVRALAAPVEVKELSRHEELELVLYLVGPQLVATVYDARTLELLATVAARDGALLEGTVGLRAHEKQGADTRLTHLSVQPAGLARAPEPAPFGDSRLVRIAAEDRARLPTGVDVRAEQGTAEARWLLTDAAGSERIRRSGLPLEVLGGEAPFWIFDPSYFAARGTAPTWDGTRADLSRSYKNPEMVEALLHGWAERHPEHARAVRLAETASGRPLWALRVTDAPDRDEGEPAVLLVGGVHGDEPPSVDYVLDAIAALLDPDDPAAARWRATLDVWCVPMANPDGAHVFLEVSTSGGRRNARDVDLDGPDPWDGVDINRNFPFRWGALGEAGSSSWAAHPRYRGPSAGSEAETRALMELGSRYQPVGVLSFHTNATTILSPYTVDGVRNPDPDEAWSLAELLAQAAGEQPNGRRYEVKRKLYSVDGTDQDWYRHRFGSAAFIVEGSHRAPTDDALRRGTIEGVRGIYRTLLDRVLDGPRLSGRVTDPSGNPLEAEVRIEGVRLEHGERWGSRALDGRFDRLLAAPGRYRLRVLREGYRPLEREVSVDSSVELDLVLQPA